MSYNSDVRDDNRDNAILFLIFCSGAFLVFLSTAGIGKIFNFFIVGGVLMYFAAAGYVMANGSALNSRIPLRKLGILLLIIGAIPFIWYIIKNDTVSSDIGLIGSLIYLFGAVMIFTKTT